MRPTDENFAKAAAILGCPADELIASFDSKPKPLSGPGGEGELCAVMDTAFTGGINLNALRTVARAILVKFEVTPRTKV